MSLKTSWFVIINPTSGGGAAKRKWPKIESLLKAINLTFQHHFTEHKGHSVQLIQSAVFQGFNKFIVVGGDGTIHHIVNGIMRQNVLPSNKIVFGVIPIGTGNDWVRTFNIPQDLTEAIEIIKKGNIIQQDIGELVFNSNQKQKLFFNNLAGIGYDGYVVSKVEKFKKLGAMAYFLGALLGLFKAKNFDVEVALDQDKFSGKALMVLVGICRYSGGGMQLTANSDYNDGFFDVSIAKGFTAIDIIINLPKLFNGKITNHPKIITRKVKTITLMTKSLQQPLAQADGELVGKGNFSARIILNAVSFYAP